MAQLLDIICIVFLGGWAYLVAKRKNRDEVGWAMAVAATFYIFGLAANQVAFPKLLDAGAFSALGSANLLGEKFDTQGQDPVPPELAEKVRLQARQTQWQTASGFVVGIPCGILLNLILTFLIRPLPTSEQRPPGGPPPTAAGDGSPPKDEQPERPADSAEGEAPAQEMAAHAVALLLQRETVLTQTADGADPVLGNILERRSGLDPIVGVALFGIIDISTRVAFILLHVL